MASFHEDVDSMATTDNVGWLGKLIQTLLHIRPPRLYTEHLDEIDMSGGERWKGWMRTSIDQYLKPFAGLLNGSMDLGICLTLPQVQMELDAAVERLVKICSSISISCTLLCLNPLNSVLRMTM